MKIIELFLGFLKVGAFAFGGAYGAIPLIRETVIARGWLDEAQFMNLLGISESTPGPIMVNTATMTGFDRAGVLGSAAATLGVILPSFLIILIVPRLRKRWGGRRAVRLAMRGVKPCLAGVICATGIELAVRLFFPGQPSAPAALPLIAVFLILCLLSFIWRRYKKKPVSPILLIVAAAALGIAFL